MHFNTQLNTHNIMKDTKEREELRDKMNDATHKAQDIAMEHVEALRPEPIDYTREVPIERDTALIDHDVIVMLMKEMCPSNMHSIIRRLQDRLEALNTKTTSDKMRSASIMKDFIKLLDTESTFHKTIKAIEEREAQQAGQQGIEVVIGR